MEHLLSSYEAEGEAHFSANTQTPLRADAFLKTDEEKILAISGHFAAIMEELGLDLNDDSLRGTPYRVAKMYVKELFSGLNPANKPGISIFENKYGYHQMLIEQDIEFISACEHHFLPMPGKAHIAYIPNGKVIGLSKINRIVKYYAKRPQVQERLNKQIFRELQEVLNTSDIIVVITAQHMCVSMRGVEDQSSRTTTISYGGKFEEKETRKDFFQMLNIGTDTLLR
ncbi:GTP cyclohydrolase I FolE [Pedobacter sp. KBW06]|uniref:GTP cyclohydrolase I FolE n=1 Tax=Pedobacter sp. KBW06 TaxID=2153359 RepID=UPI000F5AF12C|nr:GTP cyclohydrolase I FolE [Pedobacter sp. KBW06]RQO74125.1 GTP cyclohydrolase I FolE [Pedobacter sp. KBW06]